MSARDRLSGLTRRMGALAALALGALGGLAFPGPNLPLLILPAIAGLAALSATAPTIGRAALYGWAFGLGQFLVGLYWIGFAFAARDPALAPLAPAAVVGLSAGLALFVALASAAFRALRPIGFGAPMAFAGIWTLAELARGHVLTGFPWNLLAHAWVPGAEVGQAAAWIGVYGLSLVTAFAAAAPAAFLDGRRAGLAASAMAVALIAGLFALGSWRLAQPGPEALDVQIRIVQPAILQTDKWRPELRESNFAAHLTLSRAPANEPLDLVVWPETAAPGDLSARPDWVAAIGRLATPPGGAAIIGAPRRDRAIDAVYNSVFVIDDRGDVTALYDKHHLVPFGEYTPLRETLGLPTLTGAGFTPGPGPSTLAPASAPSFSPLICYEAIFPGAATGADRPQWLLTATNDAWFGDSPGPRQHLRASAYRSVEEGLPMIRAANTGISAAIDARGGYVALMPYGERGVLDLALPGRLPPTLYAQSPVEPAIPMAFALLIAGLMASQRAHKLFGADQTSGIP